MSSEGYFTDEAVVRKFIDVYGEKPMLVRSPGRINLIGEHTDYNDGFVMPAAIDKATFFAIAASPDRTSSIYALMYDEFLEVNIDNPQATEYPAWANYLLGVLRQIIDHGYQVRPFHCVFGGNIPLGAGLSSSASVECGFAFALNALNNLNIPRKKMVMMAQWAEHHFVGVKCGIMDQFASMMGSEGNVIVLDCRTLEYHYSPLHLHEHAIVLCDTKVKHSLVDSEYNTRRRECEQGVKILQKYYPGIRSLRDVTETMIGEHRSEMTGKIYDRCLYVVQEIRRVQEASEDLKANRLTSFGNKMFETHEGLSKQYEVSCSELDFLVEEAKKSKLVLGARMMGGGFGGCTINIVRKEEVKTFIARLSTAYEQAFGIEMVPYVVEIKDGTNMISESIESVTLG